ncbi:MAG: endonuclease/exonuclease/phosphatase family protein [Aquabacterium sp.]
MNAKVQSGRRFRLFGKRGLLAALVVAVIVGACATVPSHEYMLVPHDDGQVLSTIQPCAQPRPQPLATVAPQALQPQRAGTLSVANWNLHKAQDQGWQDELARLAKAHDLLLIQEAVLTPEVNAVLLRTGLRWRMAGAFAMSGVERGVLVAARADPVDACTLRAFEPLFPLPKSALVLRFRQGDGAPDLMVANLHSVNFTLGLARFREQIQAVGDELARHDGPIVLAGDLNAWSEERTAIVMAVAQRLRLTPVVPTPDGRRRAFGYALDHVFVRGYDVISAVSPVVTSSDHNPILIQLTAR